MNNSALPTRLFAGVFVGFVLIVASDFETTAPIAVGFAYLFLLSTLMIVGPAAFGNVQRLVGSPPSALSATAPSGTGGGGKAARK